MLQQWPVRAARPVAEKLPAGILSSLVSACFDDVSPGARRPAARHPERIRCGKTVISQALSKYSNSDQIIVTRQVRLSPERDGGSVGGVPELTMTLPDGSEYHEAHGGVANTSNMPVAAREASIYTGVLSKGKDGTKGTTSP